MEMKAEDRPVSWEENGYKVTRSTVWGGPGCHEGCGVLLYTQDDKLVKVEGDPLHPYNQGRICARCAALPQIQNSSLRLKYPMKRARADRGEDKFERISWDEAYDIIEREFKKAKEEHGPESLVAFTGTGRMMWEPYRLMFSAGTPNVTNELSGSSCYMPRLVAGLGVFGTVYPVVDCSQQFEDRYDNPQWRAPEVIVIWGCNVVLSNPDWFFGAWIIECMKRGSKIVVVDPRLTWLAARADIWLDLRSGTDGALALSMLDVIVNEGLYDKEFVEKWTSGFDELAQVAAQWTPDRAAKTCWIDDPQKIVDAARLYANARPGAIQLGLAVDMQVSGLPAAQAIMALMSITGNLDVPGGMIFCPDPFGVSLANVGLEEYVSRDARLKTLGHDKYPILAAGVAFPNPDTVAETLVTDEPYPLKAGIIFGTNFLTCMGQDPLKWKEGCKRLDFIAAVDLFMTPTIMELADVVLPTATFVERDSIRAQVYNLSTINKALEPPHECKSDNQIVRELGRRLNPDAWPFETDDSLLDALISVSGMTYNQIKENKGWVYPEFSYGKYEKGLLRPDGTPGFPTMSGKVELSSGFFAAFGLNPLPEFAEPFVSPVSRPDLYEEYPFLLMTGARDPSYFHSEGRQSEALRETSPWPVVELNPADAHDLGVSDGDWVWIENYKDKIRQVVRTTESIKRGMALSYHAWWFPEIRDEDACMGMWEVNNGRLLETGHIGASGFGSDVKSTLARIYKAVSSPLEDIAARKESVHE